MTLKFSVSPYEVLLDIALPDSNKNIICFLLNQFQKYKFCTVYNGFGKRNLSLNIYDIRGNTESYIINGTSDYEGAIHEYDLQLDVYNVNEVGTIETTISSNTVHFLQFKI